MYEYRDGDGELITVRSLRTLERLLADAAIREDTPFRAGGEASFVPASVHPLVGRLATELALPFAPQSTAEAAAPPTYTLDANPPDSLAQLQEPLRKSTAKPTYPRPQARPPSKLDLGPRPASPWRTSAAPLHQEVQTVAPKGASASHTTFLALVWQGAAVLAGIFAFAVVGGTSNSGIGILAELVVTAAVARTGGVRLRKRDPSGGSAPVWVAAVIFVGALSLGGMGGVFMALVAAVMLGYGWRGARKLQS